MPDFAEGLATLGDYAHAPDPLGDECDHAWLDDPVRLRAELVELAADERGWTQRRYRILTFNRIAFVASRLAWLEAADLEGPDGAGYEKGGDAGCDATPF